VMQFAGMNRAKCLQCGGTKCITYSCVYPNLVCINPTRVGLTQVLAVSDRSADHLRGLPRTLSLTRRASRTRVHAFRHTAHDLLQGVGG
jgi:hypothetical protein